jgi:hypothetical protein
VYGLGTVVVGHVTRSMSVPSVVICTNMSGKWRIAAPHLSAITAAQSMSTNMRQRNVVHHVRDVGAVMSPAAHAVYAMGVGATVKLVVVMLVLGPTLICVGSTTRLR